MKPIKSTVEALVLFSVLALGLASIPIGPSPGNQTISDAMPRPSDDDDGPREVWKLNTHHFRARDEVGANGHFRRAGAVVEQQLTIPNLDPNSPRVYYRGIEIPSEFDAGSSKLYYTMPVAIPAGKVENVTIYYDVTTNAMKQAPDYDPTWVSQSIDEYNAGYDTQRARVVEDPNGNVFVDGELVYDNSTGYVYYNSSVFYNNTDDTYRYNDELVYHINGTWYYYNGTAIDEQLTPSATQNVTQSVFVDGSFQDMLINQGGPSGYETYSVGNVRATGTAYGIYTDNFGQSVRQRVSGRFYRGSPDVALDFTSNVTTLGTAFGSGLIDLNGSIHFNETYLDRFNATDYVENETNSNVTLSADLTRLMVVTESDSIDIDADNLDWSGSRVLASDSIDTYDRGSYHSIASQYSTSDPDYDLGYSNVMAIDRVIGSISGPISPLCYELQQGSPDKIHFTGGLLNGESMVVIIKVKRFITSGDKLQVIPFVFNSRYIALFDKITHRGLSLAFTENLPFSSTLIEAWKETIGGVVRYYLNMTLNSNYWWYEPVAGMIHSIIDGDFSGIMSYISGVDTASVRDTVENIINEATGAAPSISKFISLWDSALPLKVIIHSPKPGTQIFGKIVRIILHAVVEGETLQEIKVNCRGRQNSFRGNLVWMEYDSSPNLGHYAGDLEANITTDVGSGQEIVVQGIDTDGHTVISATTNVTVIDIETTLWIVIPIAIGAVVCVGFVAHKKRSSRHPGHGLRKTRFSLKYKKSP